MHAKTDKHICIHYKQNIQYMHHVRCMQQKATYGHTWAHANKHIYIYIYTQIVHHACAHGLPKRGLLLHWDFQVLL